MLEIALLISSTATTPLADDLVHIGRDLETPEAVTSVLFKVGDVLVIDVVTGQRAMVQFTKVGTDSGKYRWRYRAPSSAQWLTGRGEVAEKQELIPEGPGKFSSAPLPGHDPIIRAGKIRAEWSRRDGRSGFLYYHPKKARVTIAPPEAFGQSP